MHIDNEREARVTTNMRQKMTLLELQNTLDSEKHMIGALHIEYGKKGGSAWNTWYF